MFKWPMATLIICSYKNTKICYNPALSPKSTWTLRKCVVIERQLTVPNIISKHKNSLDIEVSRLIEHITYSYYNIHAKCACNAHTPVTRKPYGKKFIISNGPLRKNKYFHSHLENVSDLSIWQKNRLSKKKSGVWQLTSVSRFGALKKKNNEFLRVQSISFTKFSSYFSILLDNFRRSKVYRRWSIRP